MKIGVWIGFQSVAKATLGGRFSYSSRLISLLESYHFDEEVELCFLTLSREKKLNENEYCLSLIPSIIYKLAGYSDYLLQLTRKADLFLLKLIIKYSGFKKFLDPLQIKIVYYINQAQCLDPEFPFISTNWDLGHRTTYAFPEIISYKDFLFRENFYNCVLPKSLMVFCESEAGKKELLEYTNVGKHKIRVFPLFSGPVSSLKISDETISKTISDLGLLSKHFFFYPAQFWPHKNHYNLLRAFSLFCQDFSDYKLVLTGSDKGNLEYVKGLILEYNLQEKVIILGFVSDEILYCLYKKATSLVMASHFGPTNMPPIEAMEIGCPVVCSDINGHREILGESALYFNSFDYKSIFNAMKDVVYQNDVFAQKIIKQRNMTKFRVETSMKLLNDNLMEVINIRKNWI